VDEIIAGLLNSVLGKAAEKLTEVVLEKPWSNNLEEGRLLVQQLSEEYGKDAYIRKHVLPVLKMRTLHNADYDILLDDIYYPLSATVASNKDKINIKDGFTMPFNGIVNIIGIAGQGKSTILRKLFSEEIKHLTRIPFFIELRRVEGSDIISHLMSILVSCGVECNIESVKILLQSKKIVLMLDGFDEVKHDQRVQMMNAILQLYYQYNTPIIATTRPNTEICLVSNVYNVYIDDLNIYDKVSILNVLSKNDRFSSDQTSFKVLADLICDKEELADTVCNPILVTLLYYCYPYMSDIPNNIVEFYRSLFDTLYARHDKIKAYARERKSPIIGEKAKLAFAAICYNSLMDEKFELWSDELYKYAEDAIETEGYSSECATDFISDIKDITCLIQEEGNNRHVFLHKSVQEFYAAFAVANLDIEFKKEIYASLLELIKNSEHLDNFLLFLYSLDSKTFSDEMTIRAFRDLGFVDVANMSREKAEIVFDSALRGFSITGRSTPDEDNVSLDMAFSISSALDIDLLPMLEGFQRDSLPTIDVINMALFNDSMDKSQLKSYKHRTTTHKRVVAGVESPVFETYVFPFIDFVKLNKNYEVLVDCYYDAIRAFYDRTYLPAYEGSIRRSNAMVKSFRITKK